METVTIQNTLPVSLKNMVKYFHSKFNINIVINEELIKNIINEDHSYNLYKKGKNKNKVKIVKKRKKETIENTELYINKEEYVSKTIKKDDTNKKDYKFMLKYAVERIINLKYLSNNIYLYKSINEELNNYKYLEISFLRLMDNYNNIRNIVRNIKINLDNLYNKLSEYKQFDSKNLNINIIEYEIILRKILKIIPTNEFIKII